MSAIIYIFISIILAVTGQFLLKKGMNKIGTISLSQLSSNLFKIFTNIYILTALLVFVISFLIWLTVLSKFDLSYAYPLVSTGYILVALVSLFFLKENITLSRWLGIFLIAIGSYVLTRT
tara:strand:+ start:945 stop:1304 length:360 start_codon:yes stop_codon:yes gene_type:complete